MSRSIDKILARAALDEEFKGQLLGDRRAALDASGIDLSDVQRDLLLGVSDKDLVTAIERTRVPNRARRLFMKGATYTAIGLVCGISAVLFPNSGSMADINDGPEFFADFQGPSPSLGTEDHAAIAATFMELVNDERRAWNEANQSEPQLEKLIMDPQASQHCYDFLEEALSVPSYSESFSTYILTTLGLTADQAIAFTAEGFADVELLVGTCMTNLGDELLHAGYILAGVAAHPYEARWAVILYGPDGTV